MLTTILQFIASQWTVLAGFLVGAAVMFGFNLLPIGTRSILVGAHQFIIHPLLLAIGWYRAFGWGEVQIGWRAGVWTNGVYTRHRYYTAIWDPKLWIAFFVHDFGYWGKPNMDGPEGETHPEWGAALMRRWFNDAWGDFVLLHSRHYAKTLGRQPSALCFADKWVIVLEPAWLYLPRVFLSGEYWEYREHARKRDADAQGLTPYERRCFRFGSAWDWNRGLRSYMRRWIEEHKDGKQDQWTKSREEHNRLELHRSRSGSETFVRANPEPAA